jgi:NitT/TauT family transport system permease protein
MEGTAPSPRTLSVGQRWLEPLGTAAIGLAILAAWQVASGLVFVVPAPAATFAALGSTLASGGFWTHAAATAQATALGFGIAVAVGVLLGVALGLNAYWRAAFEPIVLALHVVPKVIVYPLVLIVCGLGLVSTGLLGALLAVFPIVITVMAAVKELNPVYLKVARVAGASPPQTLLKVFVPAIRLPLVTSVRLAFSLALVGVVIGEIFASRAGLGRLLKNYYSHAEYPQMMAIVLLLIGLSLVVSLGLWSLEQRLRQTE